MKLSNKILFSFIGLVAGLIIMASSIKINTQINFRVSENSIITRSIVINETPDNYNVNISVCTFKEAVNLFLESIPIGLTYFVLEGKQYQIHKWNDNYYSFYTNVQTNKKETIQAIDEERSSLLLR